ncbi:MAG TPA: TetR/AcrR family transcriptional regulator [Pseudonocardia sp.]|jgi:AcrR family transcriptional regulator
MNQADTPAREHERLNKGARTRLRILDAGAHVLRTKGFAETRLSDIAEVAGLKTGSLSFHFPSKTALLEEVLRHGFEAGLELVAGAAGSVGANAPAGARLVAAVEAHLSALQERADYAPALLRTMEQFPADMRCRLRGVDRGYVGYWRELVTAAQAEGAMPADLDAALVVRLVLGAMNSTLGRSALAPREQSVATVLWMLGLERRG